MFWDLLILVKQIELKVSIREKDEVIYSDRKYHIATYEDLYPLLMMISSCIQVVQHTILVHAQSVQPFQDLLQLVMPTQVTIKHWYSTISQITYSWRWCSFSLFCFWCHLKRKYMIWFQLIKKSVMRMYS